ncbi:hypothetical protein [Legionella sp. W05-934-2]|uniref:hypothetical protein n=1 Tax=Legionella sp. W05-934-2 TaxID=1198649 RepID=UPI003462E60A
MYNQFDYSTMPFAGDPINGSLRMYNMFPYRAYHKSIGIDDMTAYIPKIAEMNYNAVWINPLQTVGTLVHPHPNGVDSASGSLYAMADDQRLNPLLFPVPKKITCLKQQQLFQENSLMKWTSEVRRHQMSPLFDLVLNHIGVNENDDTPIKQKLEKIGKQKNLRLLLPDTNPRWPDIQELDYYKENTPTRMRGINCEPKYLDSDKIDAIFEALWKPFIERYIDTFGFMGARVDAITHVPVPVQQKAYQLIQTLVQKKFNQPAIIVGELMIGNPENFLPAISACGLTHCLNAYSFFWGFEKEGGYQNTGQKSSFIKYSQLLSSAMLPGNESVSYSTNLVILENDLDVLGKWKKNTIYICKRQNQYFYTLSVNETDICFGKAAIQPIDQAKHPMLVLSLIIYHNLLDNHKRKGKQLGELQKKYQQIKHGESVSHIELERLKTDLMLELNHIKSQMTQLGSLIKDYIFHSLDIQHDLTNRNSRGQGIVGVVGNHDVGTLKAKVMLDIAYSRALSRAGQDVEKINHIDAIYQEFKQVTIKAIRSTAELTSLLAAKFSLSQREISQLYLDLDMRMREKIFIASLMNSGGWYSLAGDEFGLTHKPEVFQEYAKSTHVGMPISKLKGHDLIGYISGINRLVASLPRPNYKDNASLHYQVITEEVFGEKAADILFLVLRYSAESNQYYLLGHCREALSASELLTKIHPLLTEVTPTCHVQIVTQEGDIQSFQYEKGVLTANSDDGNLNKPKPEKTALTSQSVFKMRKGTEAAGNYCNDRGTIKPRLSSE